MVSLGALLVLVLYLPSAYPPSAFIRQVRAEHASNAAFWGMPYALKALSRMADFQPALAMPASAAATRTMGPPLAGQIGQIGSGLLRSSYVRSLDMLLVLVLYRLALLLSWLPAFAVLLAALASDAMVRRRIKSLEFAPQHPEWFAVALTLTMMLLCSLAVVCVLPVLLPPLLLPGILGCIACMCGQAMLRYARAS